VRPIPSGRLSVKEALVFSLVAFWLGFFDLLLFTNALTALLSLATALIYAFVYTPLKSRGPIAIWVGAVPGAIPPLMGWTAARGAIELPALVLFSILFVWQFPHFLALAWMYREDYQRAGFDFLPRRDLSGRATGRAILLGVAALLPATFALSMVGATGRVVLLGASALGLGFLALAFFAMRVPSQRGARAVFFASIVYLPLLLALIVAEKALSF
jgi:protoheme IX farnesyltransferase